MIKLINKTTGTPMWVDESRKDEYLGAGHKLAPTSTEHHADAPKDEPKLKANKRVK